MNDERKNGHWEKRIAYCDDLFMLANGQNCMNIMCMLSHNHKWNLMTIQNLRMWACEWVSFECNVLENWPNDFIYRCFPLESACRNSGKIAQQQQRQLEQEQNTRSFNWNTIALNDCNSQLRNRMETNSAYKLWLNAMCINLNSLIRRAVVAHTGWTHVRRIH